MEVYRRSSWLLLLVGLSILAVTLQGVQAEVESEGPSESECRPYIEKALKELEAGEVEIASSPDNGDSKEDDLPTIEITTDDSYHTEDDGDNDNDNKGEENETDKSDNMETSEEDEDDDNNDNTDSDEHESTEINVSIEKRDIHEETVVESGSKAEKDDSVEDHEKESEERQKESADITSTENEEQEIEASKENNKDTAEVGNETDDITASVESQAETSQEEQGTDNNENLEYSSKEIESNENEVGKASTEVEITDSKEDEPIGSSEDDNKNNQENVVETSTEDATSKSVEEDSIEKDTHEVLESNNETEDSKTELKDDEDSKEVVTINIEAVEEVEELIKESEEDLTELRPRDHIVQILKLDEESSEIEKVTNRYSEIILRELKKLYENAIKPLETLYKYRDLSNRHFGDAEIFSKPLILFMGPWSGGKSTIINYLLGIEFNETALHTGAEPSPAYFNILMYGEELEVIDATELAADYTFSGLQKFGQGLEERLHGYKLPSKLLEKVNIVEIPGILEVRKQVSRVFPFNDACQWFIDRADIIFLVYDPSKLDVGPETEAILDQLKGREHQTRIILNKADQVKPEELMRVQGALIWNISPLMSSAQPPMMYTTSLWSRPYEPWAPTKLLQAQERVFLRDLRSAIDKRIDNKIASARRFAVRVRNHAKMVDCYLTTYYNHKSVFGNRKQISDEIINHPQDYHIYEGLSTLTNISRYDLPDPDVYRDFFRLNALYDFQQLSSTCTYFRGCPINRLDVAIAYDLPELVGKHKRLMEAALNEASTTSAPSS